jgi:hypothetical protein
MEQLKYEFSSNESQPSPLGVVGFDVLRAIVAVRQSASPTARALASSEAHDRTTASPRGGASLITLFARGTASSARIAAFTGDEAVIVQDKRHA